MMRPVKKSACILLVFAMAMMSNSAAAYYGGSLSSSSTVKVRCGNQLASCAVTITWLKDGSVVDVDVLTNPADDLTIPRRATRMVIEADTTKTQAVLTVSQGGQDLVDEVFFYDGTTVAGTTLRVVFDIN